MGKREIWNKGIECLGEMEKGDMGKREKWDKGKEGICDLGKPAKGDIAQNMFEPISARQKVKL